ncbi:MAG: type II toxin-antitoxin system RelE/ParE family toxin [Pseudonocardiaceae bacterium]|nr:type II toxin-antitoxin system RelE/ParE family toxin [Pseudonocardiaceae bacterium]
MSDEPYSLRVAGPVARTIEHKLPEPVAAAVVEFLTGALLRDPYRVGKQLRRELEGTYAARRGAFRVVYEIDGAHHRVIVLRVEHRADVYRPH